MPHFCEDCGKRKVVGSNFLCHTCKVRDGRRDVESIDMQYSREFKLELREAIQDLPALRIQR